MWLLTRSGFVSAVADRNRKGVLVVRARERSALVNLTAYLPGKAPKIIETPTGRDYRFRVFVPQEDFAAAAFNLVRDIDYGNFKDSVRDEAKAGRASWAYERALHSVWSVMGRIQKGGPYGWYESKPKRRRRRGRRKRGADSVLADDLGVQRLDLGEYGTWPDDLAIEDELAALDADPLDPRFFEEAGR